MEMPANSGHETLKIQRATWKGARRFGIDDGTATELPFWGERLHLDGIEIQRCSSPGIEVSFRIPDHMFWFRVSPAPGIARVNGSCLRRCDAERGMSGVISAGCEAYIRTDLRRDATGDLDDYIRISVKPERMAGLLEHELDGADLRLIESVLPEHVTPLVPLGLQLDEIFARPGLYTRLYVDLMVETFLLRAALRWSNLTPRCMSVQPLANDRVKRAIDFIETNLSRRLTLDDLAASASMSPFHFARGFKRVTGKPPHAYVTARRVEKAKQLLRSSSLSISDIAGACGFSSQSHFTTIFRRVTGATPARFRRDAA